MIRVEFHTSIADPLDFACRLLRKACRQGVRVQVSAAPETLTALDRALWTEPERDFVPTCGCRVGELRWQLEHPSGWCRTTWGLRRRAC